MPRDKAITHEKIVRAMRDEFLAFGYEKASLNRVAEKVGITTAGLYKHFAGKEDMFFHLVKDALEAFRNVASQAEDRMNGETEYDPFRSDWATIWTNLIYSHYEGVKLLICCSAGSRFASFEDDLIRREEEGNRAYAESLRNAGVLSEQISDTQWHMLATAYVHLIFETVRHDMTRQEAEEHMRFVGRLLYPGWQKILGI